MKHREALAWRIYSWDKLQVHPSHTPEKSFKDIPDDLKDEYLRLADKEASV